MSFDLQNIPFSRYRSYLAISHLAGSKEISDGVYLRNTRGGDESNGAVFKLETIQNGKVVPFEIIFNKTKLTFKTGNGFVNLIMPDDDCLRIRGKNTGLRLSLTTQAYDNAFWHQQKSWQVNSFSKKIRFMLTPLTGKLNVDAPWNVNGCKYVVADFEPDSKNNLMDGLIEEFIKDYKPKKFTLPFDEAHNKIIKDFESWLDDSLPVPEKYEKGRELASYITWSSIVKKEGYLTRDAMYMSKNWMTNIWSWDHCFNAMALTKNKPELAWDQFMIFFDVQNKEGLLPDYINDEFAYWNCSKPPIHGWTLAWMLRRSKSLSEEKLNEIYDPLSKWTSWFVNHRDVNNNGFPEYHHGNDSGWDNSTVFHKGIPVESPDLCSFLVLQMEILSEIADILDFQEEKLRWKESASLLLDNMINYFWNGQHFAAKHLEKDIDGGDSLLLFLPIILGERLPEQIREKLVNGLKEQGRFLTDHGLATESINSPYYESDGYWRGPIWAPSTMLLIEGLASVGEEEFARELAKRFCDMTMKSGMAENFNAITGEGLRDRAFTWTSSVFLILANEYCQ